MKYLDKEGLIYFWNKINNTKQNKLVSGNNIKTINGNSLLGSGNVVVSGEEATNDNTLLFDTSKRITFTPSGLNNHANYGGCYYYKKGTRVHINVGASGLTANTRYTIATLPAGYRPSHNVANRGIGESVGTYSAIQVTSAGVVYIRSTDTYALVQIEYDAVQ